MVKDFFKTAKKTAIGNVGLGVTLGVGSSIVGQAGLPAAQAAPIQAGLGTIASFAPVATNIQMGGSVIGLAKGLQKKLKKKKLKADPGSIY